MNSGLIVGHFQGMWSQLIVFPWTQVKLKLWQNDKDIPFQWSSDYEDSFQASKHKLTIASILTLLVDREEYDLYIDTSHQGFRVVLMQMRKMITYIFYQLKIYECRYPTHNLKLVVVVFTFNICHHYLYEAKTNAYTDHKSLKYFFTQKELNTR